MRLVATPGRQMGNHQGFRLLWEESGYPVPEGSVSSLSGPSGLTAVVSEGRYSLCVKQCPILDFDGRRFEMSPSCGSCAAGNSTAVGAVHSFHFLAARPVSARPVACSRPE
jgi:hypothetical protein